MQIVAQVITSSCSWLIKVWCLWVQRMQMLCRISLVGMLRSQTVRLLSTSLPICKCVSSWATQEQQGAQTSRHMTLEVLFVDDRRTITPWMEEKLLLCGHLKSNERWKLCSPHTCPLHIAIRTSCRTRVHMRSKFRTVWLSRGAVGTLRMARPITCLTHVSITSTSAPWTSLVRGTEWSIYLKVTSGLVRQKDYRTAINFPYL